MNHFFLVVQFQLRDFLRQRRLWLTLLSQPTVAVLLVLLSPTLISLLDAPKRPEGRPVVYVVGSDRTLERFLATRGYELRRATDPEELLVRGEADLVLVSGGRRAPSKLQVKTSGRVESTSALQRLESDLVALGEGYRAPSRPRYVIRTQDVSRTSRGIRYLLGRVIPIYLWLPFSTALAMGVGLLAAEKEQRTIEPLLVLPISRLQLVLAKGAIALGFSALLFLMMLTPLVALRWIRLASGDSAILTPGTILPITLCGASLAVVTMATGVWIGAVSRSSREANAYTMIANSVMGALSFGLLLPIDIDSGLLMVALPVFGQLLALRDTVWGDLHANHVLVLISSSVLYSVVFLRLASRAVARDRAIMRPSS